MSFLLDLSCTSCKDFCFRILIFACLVAELGCQPDVDLTQSPLVTECCNGLGVCLPISFVDTSDRTSLSSSGCSGEMLCVPNELRTNPTPPICYTNIGLEGRCLPTCLPQVEEQLDYLQIDGCQEHQRCVPCYDPINGAYTGACNLGEDSGSHGSPLLLSSCCESLGRCVPVDLVPVDQREQLDSESCIESDALCVPTSMLGPEPYLPESCTSHTFGSEGRCLPSCLPDVAAYSEYLDQENCATGELCAPCFDPFTGESTGSCQIGDDPGPQTTPIVVNFCCNARGRCLPGELFPASQRELLGRDSCLGANDLCVPEEFVENPQHTPSHCTVSSLGVEGRCLSTCISQVSAQVDFLRVDGCLEHQRCVPCYDPVTGEFTDVCRLGNDDGPSELPRVFQSCCDNLGRCVPADLVPADQRDQLDNNTCESQNELCLPEPLILSKSYVPTVCTSQKFGSEGRCLPACLPGVAELSTFLSKDDCADGELCALCFDPRTGESTGSCEIGDDSGPKTLPEVLDYCCESLGRCVPEAVLPPEQRDWLGRDSCTPTDHLCVPEAFVENPQYVPKSCTISALGIEGRCLSICLPGVEDRIDLLQRDGCQENEYCVPCFDPVDGVSTGACHIGDDPGPGKPSVLLKECCQGLGRCTPKVLIPDETASLLDQNTCSNTDDLCVAPSILLKSGGTPAFCHDINNSAEGRCLPSCLPSVAAQLEILSQGECPSDFLCVPCFDPRSGESTGACSQGGDLGPNEAPIVFEDCCIDNGSVLGKCVPKTVLPIEEIPDLPSDICTDRGSVCVPTVLANDFHAAFESCTSLSSEGICIHNCFLSDIPLSELLLQSDCEQEERCVPCDSLGIDDWGC